MVCSAEPAAWPASILNQEPTWVLSALITSARRQLVLGRRLDTIALYVLNMAEALALPLARVIWTRGGPNPALFARLPHPPRWIGAAPLPLLAELAACAGPPYAEAAQAMRSTLLPGQVHVLVVGAAGVGAASLECPIHQPEDATDDPVPTLRTGTSIPPAPLVDLGTRLLEQIPSGLSPQLAERFVALCQASEMRGGPAIHCREPHCVPSAFCSCGCEGCRGATVFLMQARQEVISRNSGEVA